MAPEFSLVTGYRDREVARVQRFLDSLLYQSYRDFELIFVDYGSSQLLRQQVSTLCDHYSFCRYLYCDSEGMVWNRAHALNIGIQHASGKFFLSADVDLIYSKDVLQSLHEICTTENQVFSKAFLLPKTFSHYASLEQCPVHFNLTPEATIGLFHCVSMALIREVNGYDEYYRIWGFEDADLSQRLAAKKVVSQWMDPVKSPIYHQWHPPGNAHFFMLWWWEDMCFYYALTKHKPQSPRGVLLNSEMRPLNNITDTEVLTCPSGMSPFERRQYISEILALLQRHPDKCVRVEVFKDPHIGAVKRNLMTRLTVMLSSGLNACFRMLHLTIHLAVRDKTIHQSEGSMLYFFYTLIMKSGLLLDYSIHEDQDRYYFSLLAKPNEHGV